jgi:hypothetical protein
MPNPRWPRKRESISRTLARNLTIALVAGVTISLVRRQLFLAPPETLLALWPSLGGHYVEIAFLDGVRQHLPRTRLVQAAARMLWWLAGGTLLGAALVATGHALTLAPPPWRWCLIGGPIFVALELTVHAALALRRRPSFYRGDG